MTIVVDTSALTAVVFGEPDAEALVGRMLASAGDVMISAATVVEAHIVVEAKQGPAASADLNVLLDTIAATIAPVDAELAQWAIAAWKRFGKGRHPAALTYGDCFSYALAKRLSAPLLYEGADFTQTDLASAL